MAEDEKKGSAVGLSATGLGELRQLVERLRAPGGCPWDQEQTIDSVRAYLIEEAHEAAAAIDAQDRKELEEELGDLLFQIVFLAVLGEEEGSFDLRGVIAGVHSKMVERHPHVFPPEAGAESSKVELPQNSADVVRAWEAGKIKRREGDAERSILDGVAPSLPALTGAYRLTQKAAAVGFDWPDATAVVAKVREELEEVEAEIAAQEGSPTEPSAGLTAEVGDLLFSVANLARHLKIDPELALGRGNRKFRRRFHGVEGKLRSQGRGLDQASLIELDNAWEEIKEEER